eukprot:scaffold301_cov243-Pinguiococcus_pyrenoidosus.AAC.41
MDRVPDSKEMGREPSELHTRSNADEKAKEVSSIRDKPEEAAVRKPTETETAKAPSKESQEASSGVATTSEETTATTTATTEGLERDTTLPSELNGIGDGLVDTQDGDEAPDAGYSTQDSPTIPGLEMDGKEPAEKEEASNAAAVVNQESLDQPDNPVDRQAEEDKERPPARQAMPTFTCDDGTKTLDIRHRNDDYCDCVDASGA